MNITKIEPEQITDEDLTTILANEGVLRPKIAYTMNELIEIAKGLPPMKQLFGNLLHSGELILLAGDNGIGKTILAYQSADNLTRGTGMLQQLNEEEPLTGLYFDAEMSLPGLKERYANYTFSQNFKRIDVDDLILEYGSFSIESIEAEIAREQANFIIIDNITYLSEKSTQDQDTALKLMKDLKSLNSRTGITIIVLAHIPKTPYNRPLSKNDISGSKHLTNFAANACIMGQSSTGADYRYIKHLKSRHSKLTEQVLIMELDNYEYLHFNFVGFDDEKNHLSDVNTERDEKTKEKYREIAIEYFKGQPLRYNEFCKKYADDKGQSIWNANKLHKKLKNYNFIIDPKEDGNWILNGNEF